jgi:hypothetical protein
MLKKFNQEQLNEAVALANKEFAARERLTQKLLDLQSGRVRQALQDENLNQSERKVLLQEQEEAAEELFKRLTDGSIGSATALENTITKLEKQNELLKDVEGADFIKDILSEAAVEAENLIEVLGRAKLSTDIDVEALKRDIRTKGEIAAEEFKTAFENRLRVAPITVPTVKLQPPSFTSGSDN